MTLSLKSAVGVLLAVTTVVSLAEEQDLGIRIREAENEKRKIERELWDCKRRVGAGKEAAGARQYLWNVERVLRDAESRQKELRALADKNRALAKQLGDIIMQELAKNSDYVEAEKARGRIMGEITALEHEKALNRTKLSDRNSPIQAALNSDQTLSEMRSELYARGASGDEWKPYNAARAAKLKTIPGAAQLMKQQEEIDKKIVAKRKDADELSKKMGSIRAPIESAKEGSITQLKTKVAEARNAYNSRKKELVEAKVNPAAANNVAAAMRALDQANAAKKAADEKLVGAKEALSEARDGASFADIASLHKTATARFDKQVEMAMRKDKESVAARQALKNTTAKLEKLKGEQAAILKKAQQERELALKKAEDARKAAATKREKARGEAAAKQKAAAAKKDAASKKKPKAESPAKKAPDS